MKIALLGDIHANLPALQAVLSHAQSQHAEVIWNVGDSVGYGPFPNQVLDLLQEKDILSILGNYDLKALAFPAKEAKWRKKKHPLKLLAFQYTWQTLRPDNRAYLQSLPEHRRLRLMEKDILLIHASPVSAREYISHKTSQSRLRQLALAAAADICVCGHSHPPFTTTVQGVCFINTGSVGRPDDGDPRACYALLELKQDAMEVTHHRVAYEVQRTVDAIRQQHLPPAFAEMFLQGRNLLDIEKN